MISWKKKTKQNKKEKQNTPFGCCFHMFLTMSLCLVLPGFGKASHIIVGARVYLSTYKNDFMGTIQRKYKDDPHDLCQNIYFVVHFFREPLCMNVWCIMYRVKGVLHPWALFLKTLCVLSKNKATSDKVSYGYGQKCFKELKNHSFTSVETIVVKLQWKMCENQYFSCFEP